MGPPTKTNSVFVSGEKALKVTEVPTSLDEAKNTLNPYVPLFVNKTPWYSGEIKKKPKEKEKWYTRGTTTAATKFRKGACENCGAITHKKRDCVERPRKKGAKYSKKDIAPDERIEQIELGWAAKRDRWNGYDPQEHLELVAEAAAVEEKRNAIREQKRMEKLKKTDESELNAKDAYELAVGLSDLSDSDDEVRYGDQIDVVNQRIDTKERVTVRNLRLREDTAKYLRNLNEESAEYNPKTRSMKENPYDAEKSKGQIYLGDEYERFTGEVRNANKIMDFAWEAEQKGVSITLQANPTQGELLYKKLNDGTSSGLDSFKSSEKASVLQKYGGEEHLGAPIEMLLAQTEEYHEYSATGAPVHKRTKIIKKSRYEEDKYNGNHTSVWGSWWCDFKWGYACCHSQIKASYCGGIQAIEAEEYSRNRQILNLKREELKKGSHAGPTMAKRPGEKNPSIDPEKLAEAIKAEEDTQKEKGKWVQDVKRKFGKIDTDSMTEEQLEAYRLKKKRLDDPMANYKDIEDK